MAFKILTADQLQLLTDKQRIQYENELAVYNERVKFVEQLEKYENVVIEPYKPKLTSINIIKAPAEIVFKTPEYDVKITKPDKKATLKYNYKKLTEPVKIVLQKHPKINNIPANNIVKLEPVKIVLPKHSKINSIPVNNIKKLEPVKPNLPQINKVSAPVKQFTKIETKISSLPENKKINIPNISFKKLEQIKPNLPVISKTADITSKIQLNKYTAPEKAQVILPKSLVKSTNIKAYKKPEQAVLTLPNVTVSKQDFSIKPIKISKAKLPEILHISPNAISFNKPDIKNTLLPNISKVTAPIYKFTKIEHNSPVLPAVAKSNTVNISFNKPNIESVSLPKITKPVIPNMSFKAFNKSDKSILAIDYPSINIPKIKPYKNITVKAVQLPKIDKITVPDNNDFKKLKDLLFANKNTKTMEGANS